jgi:hypothetical protein
VGFEYLKNATKLLAFGYRATRFFFAYPSLPRERNERHEHFLLHGSSAIIQSQYTVSTKGAVL